MEGVFAGVGKSDEGLRTEEDVSGLSLTLQLFIFLLSALLGVEAPTFAGELGGESTSLSEKPKVGFAEEVELSGGTLL